MKSRRNIPVPIQYALKPVGGTSLSRKQHASRTVGGTSLSRYNTHRDQEVSPTRVSTAVGGTSLSRVSTAVGGTSLSRKQHASRPGGVHRDQEVPPTGRCIETRRSLLPGSAPYRSSRYRPAKPMLTAAAAGPWSSQAWSVGTSVAVSLTATIPESTRYASTSSPLTSASMTSSI